MSAAGTSHDTCSAATTHIPIARRRAVIEDPDAVHALGQRVADEVLAGRRVVVHCAAGLNRSGLVVGRALIYMGHRPREAVQLIRVARGRHALFNRAFEEFLLLDCSGSSAA